jgi:hypothetical protein
MCDPKTVDEEKDLEPCDLVYPDYVVENRQMYRNASQIWWWCKDQMEHEAWIFLQSDTDTSTRPGKSPPHYALLISLLLMWSQYLTPLFNSAMSTASQGRALN